MKLIVAIVQSDDAGALSDALREANFQSTLISSTGGFLREGNGTLFIGVEDNQVEKALQVIKENCHTRTQFVNPMPPVMEPGELYMPPPVEVQVGGAVVFVTPIERFEKF
ncbi:MAG TPA: cyclic-di-AMP receptor [Anaerolineae bacterium]|nr:cyclic-di-AMP receptor [Anaerolineae bacterium]